MVVLATGVLVASCAPIQPRVAPDDHGRGRAVLHNDVAFVILGINGIRVTDRSAAQHYTMLPANMFSRLWWMECRPFVSTVVSSLFRCARPRGAGSRQSLKPGHEYWVTGDLKIERLKFDSQTWDAWLIEEDGKTSRRVAECVHFPKERRKRKERSPLMEVRLPSPSSHNAPG